MKAGLIAAVIEEFAPASLQESWDNTGFTLGDINKEVKSAIVGLDCTPELVDEAISSGADMIITHHPLIFKGIKRISPTDELGRMIIKLIKHDIVVYSVHTNLDKVINGVSGVMADKLDLINRQILGNEDEDGNGLGITGEFITEKTFDETVKLVKERFAIKSLRCSKPVSEKIKRVAVCGGSGASLIPDAMRKGTQLFITGDISYHSFFCEEGFMLMDIGHFESEIGMLEIITSILRKKIPTFAVRKTEKYLNPIYYY